MEKTKEASLLDDSELVSIANVERNLGLESKV